MTTQTNTNKDNREGIEMADMGKVPSLHTLESVARDQTTLNFPHKKTKSKTAITAKSHLSYKNTHTHTHTESVLFVVALFFFCIFFCIFFF